MPQARAVPKPRDDEWWFGTWDILDKVWPISKGEGVEVAVVDSGVNASLPDLAGKILPGGDTTGHHTDGRHDFDRKGHGHGTAMAAMIVAQGKGTGVVGVALKASVLPVRVTGSEGQDVANDSIAQGIRYAADHKAEVINVSVTKPVPVQLFSCSPTMADAVDYALRHDVVVVAAAGNDGGTDNTAQVPASCPGVLAVGAVDYRFHPWQKTQRQTYVSVAAPGVQVGHLTRKGEYHTRARGTSQAAALTSAVVALVRSKFPKMSAREVVQRIIATAKDVGKPGRDLQTGYGLIRPYHALVDKVPADAPNPVFAAWDRSHNTKRATATSSSPKPSKPASKSAEADQGTSALTYAIWAVVAAIVICAAVIASLLLRRRHSGRS